MKRTSGLIATVTAAAVAAISLSACGTETVSGQAVPSPDLVAAAAEASTPATPASVPQPRTEGTDAVREIVDLYVQGLNEYWRDGRGVDVNMKAAADTDRDPALCQPTEGHAEAWACGDMLATFDYIGYKYDALAPFARSKEQRDRIGLLILMAHEAGHLVTGALDYEQARGAYKDNIADCMAGVYLDWLTDNGMSATAVESTVDYAYSTVFGLTPEQQKIAANEFREGFSHGSAKTCLAIGK